MDDRVFTNHTYGFYSAVGLFDLRDTSVLPKHSQEARAKPMQVHGFLSNQVVCASEYT